MTSLAVFAVSLDTTVLYVAFPAIRRSFASVSTAELSWVLNAYTVLFGALLVPAGRLADRIGRRRTFLAGVSLFTLASLVCGIAPSAPFLIAARAGQAIGAAMLLPSSLALVLAAFPRERRAVAVSIWGAVGALSAAIGPSLGSLIVDTIGWRAVFLMNLPVGLVALLRTRRVVPESRNTSAGPLPHPAGIALLVVAVGALALAIVQGDTWGWQSARTIGAFGVTAFAFVVFTIASRHAAAPVIDLTLFRDRTFGLANAATLVFSVAFTAMFFALILFQTQVWGYSILEAGLGITPGPLMVMPTAILGGRIAARRGHGPVLIVGGIIYALGGLLQVTTMPAHPAYVTHFLPMALLNGVGIGLVLPSLAGAAVHGLSESRFALGSAVNQAVRQVGSVIGVALVVALLERSPNMDGFRHIFALLVIGGLGTALFSLGIDTRPRR
ncbi:MAG TPA: MFS transporter [Kofleriaceae bacterium]|nr:MFS transporter [Kofleriaceae bacterium]